MSKCLSWIFNYFVEFIRWCFIFIMYAQDIRRKCIANRNKRIVNNTYTNYELYNWHRDEKKIWNIYAYVRMPYHQILNINIFYKTKILNTSISLQYFSVPSYILCDVRVSRRNSVPMSIYGWLKSIGVVRRR